MATTACVNVNSHCPICFSWRFPIKILSCGHSYCHYCLYRLVKLECGCFPCPICRSWHMLWQKNIDRLPTNFDLQQLIERIALPVEESSITVDTSSVVSNTVVSSSSTMDVTAMDTVPDTLSSLQHGIPVQTGSSLDDLPQSSSAQLGRRSAPLTIVHTFLTNTSHSQANPDSDATQDDTTGDGIVNSDEEGVEDEGNSISDVDNSGEMGVSSDIHGNQLGVFEQEHESSAEEASVVMSNGIRTTGTTEESESSLEEDESS